MTEVGSTRPGYRAPGSRNGSCRARCSALVAPAAVVGHARSRRSPAWFAMRPGRAPRCDGRGRQSGPDRKVRTAVSDGTGQYRLENLRPGTYTLTFSLTGFSQVKRENVEVSGARHPVDQRRHARRRRAGDDHGQRRDAGRGRADEHEEADRARRLAIIEALPSSRGYGNLLTAVPGIQNNSLDNGTNPTMVFFTAHGGRGNEGTVQIDGMNVGASFNGGGVSSFGYHDRRTPPKSRSRWWAASARVDRGGPAFNIIPKTGGNTLQRQRVPELRPATGRRATTSTHELQAFGIPDVPTLHQELGQQLRARAARSCATGSGSTATCARSASTADVPGMHGNKNAGDPERVELRRGPQPAGAQRQRQEDRRHPPHRPADAAQQGRLLRGLSEELHRVGRTRRTASSAATAATTGSR